MQMDDYNRVETMSRELALIALRVDDVEIKTMISDCVELLEEALGAEDDRVEDEEADMFNDDEDDDDA